MAGFIALPLATRFALLFVVGCVSGVLANYGIYRLAWYKRRIGPWGKQHDDALPGTWWDRLPVIGWIGLRRDEAIHGRGYWVRPILIELGLGLGLMGL